MIGLLSLSRAIFPLSLPGNKIVRLMWDLYWRGILFECFYPALLMEGNSSVRSEFLW